MRSRCAGRCVVRTFRLASCERWFPFKESFSPLLVRALLSACGCEDGVVLDPFAGAGTALFAARAMGLDAEGIELLPPGCEIIRARAIRSERLDSDSVRRLRMWIATKPWRTSSDRIALPEMRITRGAYPAPTRDAIERYLGACQHERDVVQTALRFALLCILESVSFARRDGQYLRWDYRSGRARGTHRFNKGAIPTFDRAICAKINELIDDVVHGQTSMFSKDRCACIPARAST